MRAHFNRPELFEEVDLSLGRHLHFQVELTTKLSKIFGVPLAIRTTKGLIDDKMNEIPHAYGLIKLHKQPHKLRIITPVVNWINVKAAKFVADNL